MGIFERCRSVFLSKNKFLGLRMPCLKDDMSQEGHVSSSKQMS